jgi:hypothetical protein
MTRNRLRAGIGTTCAAIALVSFVHLGITDSQSCFATSGSPNTCPPQGFATSGTPVAAGPTAGGTAPASFTTGPFAPGASPPAFAPGFPGGYVPGSAQAAPVVVAPQATNASQSQSGSQTATAARPSAAAAQGAPAPQGALAVGDPRMPGVPARTGLNTVMHTSLGLGLFLLGGVMVLGARRRLGIPVRFAAAVQSTRGSEDWRVLGWSPPFGQ